MKHPKLRIAWTVAWGIAAVLLIALWVRSYWRVEHFVWNSRTKAISASIYPGQVSIDWMNDEAFLPLGWSYDGYPITRGVAESEDGPKTVLGFGWKTDDDSIVVDIPFWFSILICGVIAISPTMHFKRFSLRTLLLATTIVAVGLGMIVWATK